MARDSRGVWRTSPGTDSKTGDGESEAVRQGGPTEAGGPTHDEMPESTSLDGVGDAGVLWGALFAGQFEAVDFAGPVGVDVGWIGSTEP